MKFELAGIVWNGGHQAQQLLRVQLNLHSFATTVLLMPVQAIVLTRGRR